MGNGYQLLIEHLKLRASRRILGLLLLALLGLTTTLTIPVLSAQHIEKTAETITQAANAQSLLQQGIELYQAERFSEAAAIWQQANSAFVSQGNNLGQALVLTGVLNLFPTIRIRQQMALAQTTDERKSEADRLVQEGNDFYGTGQVLEALEVYQQALKIYQDINDRFGELNVLKSIGWTYAADLGDDTQAIKFYLQSLAIARDINDHESEFNSLERIAYMYYLRNDEQAFTYYQEIFILAQKLNNPNKAFESLFYQGYLSSNLRNYTKAIDYFQQGLSLAQSVTQSMTASECKSKFEEHYCEGLFNQESYYLDYLGLTYFKLRDYNQALNYFQQSLSKDNSKNNESHKKELLRWLGLTYLKLERYSQAIEPFQQYLALTKKSSFVQDKAQALSDLGLALYKSGNLEAAEQNLFQALQSWQTHRTQLGGENASDRDYIKRLTFN